MTRMTGQRWIMVNLGLAAATAVMAVGAALAHGGYGPAMAWAAARATDRAARGGGGGGTGLRR